MKKLLSLLASGLLAISPLASQETQKNIFVKLGIPEKFMGYEKMKVANNNFVAYGSGVFHFQDYTDWKILVREIRKVNPVIENGINEEYSKTIVSQDEEIPEERGRIVEDKYPSIIIFDFNENFIYEENETLIDEKADGINGNEIWLMDLKLESAQKKI